MSTDRVRVLLVGNAKHVHVRRWAVGLAETGCDITVFGKTPAEMPGVAQVLSEPPPVRPWRPFRWPTRHRQHLKDTIRRLRPDIVHVHQLYADSAYPEDLGATRLVVSTWGKDVVRELPETGLQHRLKRDILHAAGAVLASSEMLRRETISYSGLDASRVQTLYWGVDLEKFRRTVPHTNQPVVGFFKHLLPKYGPAILIQALALVVRRFPDVMLLMAGTGDQDQELQVLARRLKVDRRIEWVGKVDHASIVSQFQRCLITAMPSTVESETLGIAALESQALEIPVVASNIGGIPESVVDGRTGLLVKPSDVEDLARGIEALLSDHERVRELGTNGRRRIEELFDWRKTLRTTVEIYHDLLDGRSIAARPHKTSEKPLQTATEPASV